MAKKRSRARKVVRRKTKSVGVSHLKSKISIVVNNILLFVALSLVSLVLSRYLNNIFLANLFTIMAMIFGFVSAAFLITLVVLFVMKLVSKKSSKRRR